MGVRLVSVSQGYTKCSVAVVDDHALITSDNGIAVAARECGCITDPAGLYFAERFELWLYRRQLRTYRAG